MKIYIISDTHVRSLRQLPEKLMTQIKQADLIIHAGDFTDFNLLKELQSIGNVKAVCGNMDSSDIRKSLPLKEQFEINGRRIAVTHGSGSREGLTERVRDMFLDDPDIIIFGHSHQHESRVVRGTLMINPGPARSSFVLLEIEDDVNTQIVTV